MNQVQINYVPQMASIAERVNQPIRLVQCIQMFNEEEFAPLVLASIYDEVDQIIVIEGAVGERSDATEDGHSTDRTLEIVKEFMENSDPDNKVQLISIKRPWKSLEEMKQTFLDLTSQGDWLIINDADEIYRPEDIRRVRVAIDRHPHASEIVPLFLHFYRDFSHVAVPGPEWQPQHQRVIKNMGGMKYNSHPVATMMDGHCSYFSPWMQQRRYMMPNFFVFHYGYARSNMDEVMEAKQAYYEKELAKHDGANRKFDQKVRDWIDGTEPLLYFHDMTGSNAVSHPEVMRRHPLWETANAPISDGEIVWRDSGIYQTSFRGEDIPNVWLCMTGQAAPQLPLYSNMVDDDI